MADQANGRGYDDADARPAAYFDGRHVICRRPITGEVGLKAPNLAVTGTLNLNSRLKFKRLELEVNELELRCRR